MDINELLKFVDESMFAKTGKRLNDLQRKVIEGALNYQKYGDLIGVDLVKNPDLIFIPKNSYNVSVAYLTDKRGKSKKSTFDWLDEGNLTRARKSINAKGVEKANKEYAIWKKILENNLEKPKKILIINLTSIMFFYKFE